MSDIYLQITETPTVVTLSAPVVSGALASTVTVANTVTVALDANSLSALENVTVTVGAAITGTVTVSNFPATVTIGNTVTIAGTVTANPTGTQTIAGTVTANLGSAFINTSGGYQPVQFSTGLPVANEKDGITFDAIPFLVAGSVTIGSALPAGTNRIGVVTIGGGTVTIGAGTSQIGSVTASISGTVPVSGTFWQATQPVSGTFFQATQPVSGTFWQATQPVSLASTTVTISANPAGPLTTRFGSVTTANTSQLTAAVTNTAREYLFIQNISTGSVTVGVGFSPTTTQGIQLSPGSGITFDSFCPTGAVWWLGATTGAAWTILEG